MEILIRPARKEDFIFIKDLAIKNFKFSISPLRKINLKEAENKIQAILKSWENLLKTHQNLKILVAEAENKIIGYVMLKEQKDLITQIPEFFGLDLAVEKEFRKCGVALALFKEALNKAKELNLKYFSCLITSNNTASLNLAQKLGLKEEYIIMLKRID
ncbi:MAG: GNAT family N-acetyltransferase [Armatimonadetes bacterium]|nr:GNAT family N-acetyltransferase [Armatimonadota bacterium]